MKVELISHTGNPIMTCAIAASMCYQSTPSVAVVKQCIASGHHSVLEHCSFTFKITNVSRTLLAQLTRHRLASFSVESQRFVDYCDKKPEFVMPNVNGDIAELIAESAHNSMCAYNELRQIEIKAEDARAVLPNCMPTNLVMTVNLRELAAICNLRLCNNAQLEIRNLFYKIKDLLESHPDFDKNDQEIFKLLLVPNCEKHQYAFCTEAKCCGKHKQLSTLLADNVDAKKRW